MQLHCVVTVASDLAQSKHAAPPPCRSTIVLGRDKGDKTTVKGQEVPGPLFLLVCTAKNKKGVKYKVYSHGKCNDRRDMSSAKNTIDEK